MFNKASWADFNAVIADYRQYAGYHISPSSKGGQLINNNGNDEDKDDDDGGGGVRDVDDAKGQFNSASLGMSADDLMEYMKRKWTPVTREEALTIIRQYDSTPSTITQGRRAGGPTEQFLDEDDFTQFVFNYRWEKSKLNLQLSASVQDASQIAAGPGEGENDLNISNNALATTTALTPGISTKSDASFATTTSNHHLHHHNGRSLNVNDELFYVRRLRFHIMGAMNLTEYLRVKPRQKVGIQMQSIDPLVSIRFSGGGGGITESRTMALVDNVEPEWDQILEFTVRIPFDGDPIKAYRWVQRQHFSISICDYCDIGLVPHLERLAGLELPLESVLGMPTETSEWRLFFDDRSKSAINSVPIGLDIHVTNLDQSKYPWSIVKDVYYRSLTGFGFNPSSLPEQVQSELSELSIEYFRRQFLAVVMFGGSLMPLDRILRPIESGQVGDLNALAESVALIKDSVNRPLEEVLPVEVCIYKREATQLEKSILLWGLLKKLGLNVFIAAGLSQNSQMCFWITVLNSPQQQQRPPSSPIKPQKPSTPAGPKTESLKKQLSVKTAATLSLPKASPSSPQSPKSPVAISSDKNLPRSAQSSLDVTFYDLKQGKMWDLKKMMEGTHNLDDEDDSSTVEPLENMPLFFHLLALINDEAIYMNTQQTTKLTSKYFDWATVQSPNSPSWKPILQQWPQSNNNTKDVLKLFNAWTLITPTNHERVVVDKLMSIIRSFRKNQMFIPDTQFHSQISIVLRNLLNDFYESTNGSSTKIKNKKLKEYRNAVDAKVTECLIPGWTWHGQLFYLPTTIVHEMFQILVDSGLLECSVRNVVYAFAVHIVPNQQVAPPSCLLHIGYMFNLFS